MALVLKMNELQSKHDANQTHLVLKNVGFMLLVSSEPSTF